MAKCWTKSELNAQFSMEGINGKRLLLIWQNLARQDVINFSPIIANRKAMTNATVTAKDIAEKLALLEQEEITMEE